jgi:hypothetical protein
MSEQNTGTDGQASRRQFLTGAAGALVGAGVLGAAGAASAAPPRARTSRDSIHPALHPAKAPHRHYRRGTFEGAKGGRLRITLPGGPVSVTITDIEPLDVVRDAKAGSRHWQNAFRVTMKGEKGTTIPQGTHPVSVNGSSFDLFVVPIMSTSGTPRYEAIIHRAYHRRVQG